MVRKKSKWPVPLILLSLTTWMSCQYLSSRESLPVSAGALVQEYETSQVTVRNKYDGKEITVSGTALTVPTMPRTPDEQGSVLLEDKGQQLEKRVACLFGNSQVEQFSRITAGQLITVKGVFNGEVGLDLKFCKLVKVE